MSSSHGRAADLMTGECPHIEAVYACCPYLFCVLDGEGAIRGVNAAAEAFFGYSLEELVGHELTSLVHPADQYRARNAIVGAREASTGVVMLRFEWGRDIERQLKWTFIRMSDSDPVIAWATDVTESRAVEEELRARIERLQELLAQRTRELVEAKTRAECLLADLAS